MTTLTLYELADEYRSASERMMELEFDEATITDTLEGLSGDLTTKMNNIAQMTRNFDSAVDAIKEAEKKMKQRRDSISKRAEWLHFYLKSNMERAGVSSSEAWKFEIADALLVPREYLMIDETKIRKVVQALKAETNIPGVRVYSTWQLAAKAG